MDQPVPAPLPDWLSENYASLRTDGVLDLFGTIDDRTALAIAPRIKKLPGLVRLVFRAEGLTDPGIAALAGVGVEVEVECISARNLDALLPFVDRVVGLRVDVPGDIALACAESVARFTALRRIDTHLAGWHDDHLAAAVGPLRALESIGLRGASLTGAGLAALPCPERLRSLDLGKTAVTDACVDTLIAMDSLTSVGVGKTKISKKGVARLTAARRGLHVSTYA